MRALGRPGQFAIPSITFPVGRPYDSLHEMQVWVGMRPTSLYVAHWTGHHWFLLDLRWPDRSAYRLTVDGRLWAYRGRGFDYRCKTTLDDLAPTGDTARQCTQCESLSLPSEDRHRPECPLR